MRARWPRSPAFAACLEHQDELFDGRVPCTLILPYASPRDWPIEGDRREFYQPAGPSEGPRVRALRRRLGVPRRLGENLLGGLEPACAFLTALSARDRSRAGELFFEQSGWQRCCWGEHRDRAQSNAKSPKPAGDEGNVERGPADFSHGRNLFIDITSGA
ncbi:MAG: hypothetical protein U5L46_01760 [Agrobacterium sp.]|nr:hypothetical protein [Agrobacterium sp.]